MPRYEVHRAKNIAMIGHGNRWHIQFLDPLDEFSTSQAPSSME